MSLSAWRIVRLKDVTTKIGSGATPRGGAEAYQASGIPLIRSMNVHFDGVRDDGLAFISDVQASELDGATVRDGDVLLNITGASIGRVAKAPSRLAGARVNQHVCILRPTVDLEPGYLAAYLQSPGQQQLIASEESGATRQALTKAKLENREIPLPPVEDQRRIVAHLDACFARSRRAKAALDEVPALVDRLRQSILAAAFRGDLTADWREENPNVEPASVLLERIRVERRRRWEEAELAKIVAKGKPPKDDRWKAKYVEPEPVDEEGLPELPEGWCWSSLRAVAQLKGGITKGQKRAPGTALREVPYLRVANVQRGYIDTRDIAVIEATEAEIQDLKLEPGDILFNEGGDRDKLGRGWVWSGELPLCIHQNHVFRGRLTSADVQPKLISWYANSAGQEYFLREGSQTTNLASINITKLGALPIPIPPAAEQAELVRLIGPALARTEAVMDVVATSSSAIASAERACLDAAFSLADHDRHP